MWALLTAALPLFDHSVAAKDCQWGSTFVVRPEVEASITVSLSPHQYSWHVSPCEWMNHLPSSWGGSSWLFAPLCVCVNISVFLCPLLPRALPGGCGVTLSLCVFGNGALHSAYVFVIITSITWVVWCVFHVITGLFVWVQCSDAVLKMNLSINSCTVRLCHLVTP